MRLIKNIFYSLTYNLKRSVNLEIWLIFIIGQNLIVSLSNPIIVSFFILRKNHETLNMSLIKIFFPYIKKNKQKYHKPVSFGFRDPRIFSS